MKKFFSLFLTIAACASASFACFVPESGEPPCASWTRADIVFSGKVLKIEGAQKSEDLPDGTRKVLFEVAQNFKGAENKTIAVFAADAKTGGGLSFKRGETWIVYAMNDIVFKSFTVFRGAKIDPKTPSDELETLKSVIDGKSSTAIAGKLVAQNNSYTYEPAEISVESGGKRFSGKSEPDGSFNIAVPADGKYKVEIKFPFRAFVKGNEFLLNASNTEGEPTVFRYEVKLNDGDCNYNVFEVTKK